MIICRISELLKLKGLTQKDIYEKLNINKNTLSNYANNKFTSINKEHLSDFCEFFDCTPNDIFQYMTETQYLQEQSRRNRPSLYLDRSLNIDSLFSGGGKLQTTDVIKPYELNFDKGEPDIKKLSNEVNELKQLFLKVIEYEYIKHHKNKEETEE